MNSEPQVLNYSMITIVEVGKVPWSEAEDRQLRQMTLDGLNRNEMSRLLKRSTAAIARRCFKLGLTRARGNHALVQATITALNYKQVGPNTDTLPTINRGEPRFEQATASMIALINQPAPRRNQYSCDIMDLNNSRCRWPYGNPQKPGFFYCGAPTEPTKPYCTKHCNKAYNGRIQVKVDRAKQL